MTHSFQFFLLYSNKLKLRIKAKAKPLYFQFFLLYSNGVSGIAHERLVLPTDLSILFIVFKKR